ncbi:MAG: helix-turn-helix transcriptional regulator [Gemmatimonadetes bacterium]|nr:helix-turn-helix transcriptional regulator [Gemmatimonadota bacterium]
MAEARVPMWYAATGLHGENQRVYDAFQEFLHNLPMSYTDLAACVGVSQPAVSRWATNVTHPSLEEMSEAVGVARSCIDEIQQTVDRITEVLRLVEEAMRLYEVEIEGRGHVDQDQQHITARLRQELGLAS